MVGPLTATGPDAASVKREREHIRQLLTFLYSTPSYWPSLDLYGWRERGERLHELSREGRWGDMAELVDDTMLSTFAPTGPYAEIVDVRTLAPLDVTTLADSVRKTGRCLIAHEATRFSGFGAELAATIQEECFYYLEAPIERVAGWDTPYPHAFEWQYFPGQKRIAAGIRKVMAAG